MLTLRSFRYALVACCTARLSLRFCQTHVCVICYANSTGFSSHLRKKKQVYQIGQPVFYRRRWDLLASLRSSRYARVKPMWCNLFHKFHWVRTPPSPPKKRTDRPKGQSVLFIGDDGIRTHEYRFCKPTP